MPNNLAILAAALLSKPVRQVLREYYDMDDRLTLDGIQIALYGDYDEEFVAACFMIAESLGLVRSQRGIIFFTEDFVLAIEEWSTLQDRYTRAWTNRR